MLRNIKEDSFEIKVKLATQEEYFENIKIVQEAISLSVNL